MKNSNKSSEDFEKVNEENASLRQQLKAALETIDLIKSGNIDALVDRNKKELTLYTAKTADKTYRILIEKMHEGAVTLDQSGTILFCNSSFAKMVDLPLQKVIGRKFKNFITSSSKEHSDSLFKQCLKQGHAKDSIQLDRNQSSNEEGMLAVLISINTFEMDDYLFLSVILTDISLRNKAQAELKLRTIQIEQKNAELKNVIAQLLFENEEKVKRAAELSIANKELIFQKEEKKKRAVELSTANTDVKELGELVAHKDSILAILSHDLRSPLAGIVGIAEYLKSNFESMDITSVNEMLQLIHHSSKEELNMLDYLVEWARIKYAAEVFSPSKIELVHYVNKVFDLLKETALLNNINLKQEIEQSTSVFADGKMVLSILQNIVSNAIKHSQPGGKITVTTKRKDDKIIVEIKDNGTGMSKEMQKNLFSPQMQILSKERIDNKGAGIGLLLVKGFLEKNGGEIWVESAEGVGSSFYFSLPSDNPYDERT